MFTVTDHLGKSQEFRNIKSQDELIDRVRNQLGYDNFLLLKDQAHFNWSMTTQTMNQLQMVPILQGAIFIYLGFPGLGIYSVECDVIEKFQFTQTRIEQFYKAYDTTSQHGVAVTTWQNGQMIDPQLPLSQQNVDLTMLFTLKVQKHNIEQPEIKENRLRQLEAENQLLRAQMPSSQALIQENDRLKQEIYDLKNNYHQRIDITSLHNSDNTQELKAKISQQEKRIQSLECQLTYYLGKFEKLKKESEDQNGNYIQMMNKNQQEADLKINQLLVKGAQDFQDLELLKEQYQQLQKTVEFVTNEKQKVESQKKQLHMSLDHMYLEKQKVEQHLITHSRELPNYITKMVYLKYNFKHTLVKVDEKQNYNIMFIVKDIHGRQVFLPSITTEEQLHHEISAFYGSTNYTLLRNCSSFEWRGKPNHTTNLNLVPLVDGSIQLEVKIPSYGIVRVDYNLEQPLRVVKNYMITLKHDFSDRFELYYENQLVNVEESIMKQNFEFTNQALEVRIKEGETTRKIQRELQETKERLSNSQRECEYLRNKLAQQEEDSKNRESLKNHEMQQQKSEMMALQKELLELSKSIELHKSNHLSEKTTLLERVDEYKRLHRQKSQELEQEKVDLQALKQEFMKCKQKYQDLMQEVSKNKQVIGALNQENHGLKDENEKLNEEVQKLKKENQFIESLHEMLLKDYARLKVSGNLDQTQIIEQVENQQEKSQQFKSQ